MSEVIQTPARTNRSRTIVLVAVVVSILFLFLAYGTIWIALPFMILNNYQGKNCDAALRLDKI